MRNGNLNSTSSRRRILVIAEGRTPAPTPSRARLALTPSDVLVVVPQSTDRHFGPGESDELLRALGVVAAHVQTVGGPPTVARSMAAGLKLHRPDEVIIVGRSGELDTVTHLLIERDARAAGCVVRPRRRLSLAEAA